jgi:hypothetical protein
LNLQQSPSIPELPAASPRECRIGPQSPQRNGLPNITRVAILEVKNPAPPQRNPFFTRNGATSFLSPDRLKIVVSSVLLSNPLTKDDFPFRYNEFLIHTDVPLRIR